MSNIIINQAAQAGEVFVCGGFKDGDPIPCQAGSTTDDYAVHYGLESVGVPSDSYLPDNFFSGASCNVISSAAKDRWRVEAISMHSIRNGAAEIKPYPINIRVLIIRVR